jgi:putative transposase
MRGLRRRSGSGWRSRWRRFRILAIIDDFTRECLALVADTSLPGLRVVRELEVVVAHRGRPAICLSDNGTELTSMVVLRWCQEMRIERHYIAPGKPTQNAFVEIFQRATARRTPQRDAVHLAQPGPRRPGRMGARLQHGPATQRAQQSDASRIRRSQRLWPTTGRGAALCRGLRGPPPCSTEPYGLK